MKYSFPIRIARIGMTRFAAFLVPGRDKQPPNVCEFKTEIHDSPQVVRICDFSKKAGAVEPAAVSLSGI